MDTITNLINIIKSDQRNNYDLHDNIKHISYHLQEYSKSSPYTTVTFEELIRLFNTLEEQADKSPGPFYS